MFGLFKKKKPEEKGFNSAYINIVIERQINNSLIQEVGEFIATQKKSSSKSLVIENQKMGFIEELDFSENALISTLKTTLEFKDLEKFEKLKLLNENIKAQTDRISRIKEGYYYPLNNREERNNLSDTDNVKESNPIKVNLIDEKIKLRLLEVLKEHTEDYDNRGIYEVINSRGYRELRFLVEGEFLYPLCRSPNKKTIYRNMVTKKKVYKVEYDLNQKEFEQSTTSKIQNFFKNAMPFMVIVLFIVLMFAFVNLNNDRAKMQDEIKSNIAYYQNLLAEADKRCVEASTKCSFFLSEFTKDNQQLISYANEQMNMLTTALNNSLGNKKDTSSMNYLRDQVINKVINEAEN